MVLVVAVMLYNCGVRCSDLLTVYWVDTEHKVRVLPFPELPGRY